MSGTVNAAGWYMSTQRELENASLPSVISEDIHNIEHYYQQQGADAPIVEIIYGSCIDPKTKVPLFFRASNMPHTAEIIEKKFTAFAMKSAESMVATHGFGALLPSMYIGGNLEIQFADNGEWKRVLLDINKQYEECKTKGTLTTLPTEALKLGRGEDPLIENTRVWSDKVIQLFGERSLSLIELFKERGICTIEVHESPSFKGHGNIRDRTFFCQFLESIQGQFEEILEERVNITGIYFDDSHIPFAYELPYNFYKELYNKSSTRFPVSPYGITELESYRDFDIDYTDTSTHCRTKIDENYVFFDIQEKVCKGISPIPNFQTRFSVRIGKIDKDVYDYASHISTATNHPMHLQNLQSFADSLLVNLDGYRMTLKPIPGRLQRSQYLPHTAHTRVLVDVKDPSTKQKYIDAKAHKDTSTLQSNRAYPNLIEAVVEKLCKLLKKADTDNKIIQELTVVHKLQKVKRRTAIVDGFSYEKNCADVLRDSLNTTLYSVVEGDVAIRKEYLETNDKQYTGIDILVKSGDGIAIAVQCKRKDRVSNDDYESFLRTLQYARKKHGSQYVHGLFVVQKQIDPNPKFFELVSTPSVNLICVPDTGINQIVASVKSILQYYAATPN